MGAFDGLRRDQVSSGYWGHHSGSIDWCEENYTHTPFIAEWYNTITNLPVVVIGLYGALMTILGGLQKRYALLYLGLSGIGIGSFGFHATLRWEWQMLDELPMIWIVSYGAYLVTDTLPTFKPRFGIWGYLSVVVFCIFITFCYIQLNNPIYHEIAFAAIMLSVVARNAVLLFRIPKGHPSKGMIAKTFGTGVLSFFIAFVIWNIDNLFCDELRAMRGEMGLWGFLLQGHGFWHLGTGYGSFLIFTATIYMQLAIKVSPDAYTFDSTSWLPVVRLTLPAHEKSRTNTGNDTPPNKEPQSAEKSER